MLIFIITSRKWHTRKAASLFSRFVSDLYERSILFLTTNQSFREWPQVFSQNESLTVAILGRLLHHAHLITIKGRSWRLRKLGKALSFMTDGFAGPGDPGSIVVDSAS